MFSQNSMMQQRNGYANQNSFISQPIPPPPLLQPMAQQTPQYLIQQQQMQPQQQQMQMPQQVQQSNMFKCFQVNNKAEVDNFGIDAFGVFVLLDNSSNKIYTKQINDNGLLVTNGYTLDTEVPKEVPKAEIQKVEEVPKQEYIGITKQDFEDKFNLLADKLNSLESKLDEGMENKNGCGNIESNISTKKFK